MDFSIEISSGSEDDGKEIPFAERVAFKTFGDGKNKNNQGKTSTYKPPKMSSAFSDSDSDLPSPPPPDKKQSIQDSVSVTPPPDYISPYRRRTAQAPSSPDSPSNDRKEILPETVEVLPDTEELVSATDICDVDSLSPNSSVSSKASIISSSTLSKNDGKVKNKKTKEMKELDKLKKHQEKMVKQKSKELDKQKNKALKEAEKIVAKQTDKTEVHKYLMVIIDPTTVSCPPGSEILNMLNNPPDSKAENVFQYQVENLHVPGSLTWRRKVISYEVISGEVQLLENWQEEGRVLVFLAAEDLAGKVENGSLKYWAENTKKCLGGKHLTLMVYNYNAYFKADKNAKERVRKAVVRGENPARKDLVIEKISLYKMEEALVSLSLDRIADHLTFDRGTDKGWRDCGGSVFHQTRAVAEAPLKLKRGLSGSAGFNFWAKADSKDSVAPKNLPEYWKQVLMQVSSGAGLEKAAAIASMYPSPRDLVTAYSRCSSSKQCEDLLANLEVRRTDNILGGTRKVGPDISRRIYLVMTESNPDTLLSKK